MSRSFLLVDRLKASRTTLPTPIRPPTHFWSITKRIAARTTVSPSGKRNDCSYLLLASVPLDTTDGFCAFSENTGPHFYIKGDKVVMWS